MPLVEEKRGGEGGREERKEVKALIPYSLVHVGVVEDKGVTWLCHPLLRGGTDKGGHRQRRSNHHKRRRGEGRSCPGRSTRGDTECSSVGKNGCSGGGGEVDRWTQSRGGQGSEGRGRDGERMKTQVVRRETRSEGERGGEVSRSLC